MRTYKEHVWQRADYEALFDPAPGGALRGEGTVFYLYDTDAHERIHDLAFSVHRLAIRSS